MSNILVTGSKGVIGRKLVEILTADGHNVFGIDLYHSPGETGWEVLMAKTPHTYSRCDVADYRQLERIFSECGSFEYVYHCAAEFGRWNGEDFYEQVWRTNASGTKNIIRLQEKYGFKLIHFSSSEVYGDFPEVMEECVLDKYPISQLNDYALSKRVNELQIKNSVKVHDTKTVIVRLFNTYGPGETYHPYRSVNAKLCYHALHGIPVVVYKNYVRTSTYLDDCCRTLANIVKNFKPGETYNIGGNETHTIEELVDIVWNATGADRMLITYEDNEQLTTRKKLVNVEKAVKDLGHTSTISLKEGVKRTVEWMKHNENLSSHADN